MHHQNVVHSTDGQHRDGVLLGEHRGRRENHREQRRQDASAGLRGVASAHVQGVAQEGQDEEQTRQHVGPADHPCHGFGVNRVGSEQQPCGRRTCVGRIRHPAQQRRRSSHGRLGLWYNVTLPVLQNA